MAAATASARGTGAGTSITSSTTATYLVDGAPVTVNSNHAAMRVQEVLDVSTQPGSGERLPAGRGDSARPLPFLLTNLGNGQERFALSLRTDLGGDTFDPSCTRIVLDANGNGQFDPATDVNYVPSGNDPELRPDQSLVVFALCDLPKQLDSGDGLVALHAIATTGSGIPGTALLGLGDQGTDAVIGATNARATGLHGFVIVDGVPQLSKSQQVVDPTGSTNPVADARITYALVASIGSGTAPESVIADAIPAGTTYEAGSLRLDGAPLTDVSDADAGRFTGQNIEVQLGTLTAGAPHTVSFSVKIDQR